MHEADMWIPQFEFVAELDKELRCKGWVMAPHGGLDGVVYGWEPDVSPGEELCHEFILFGITRMEIDEAGVCEVSLVAAGEGYQPCDEVAYDRVYNPNLVDACIDWLNLQTIDWDADL